MVAQAPSRPSWPEIFRTAALQQQPRARKLSVMQLPRSIELWAAHMFTRSSWAEGPATVDSQQPP